jgi:hypothetical protein
LISSLVAFFNMPTTTDSVSSDFSDLDAMIAEDGDGMLSEESTSHEGSELQKGDQSGDVNESDRLSEVNDVTDGAVLNIL